MRVGRDSLCIPSQQRNTEKALRFGPRLSAIEVQPGAVRRKAQTGNCTLRCCNRLDVGAGSDLPQMDAVPGRLAADIRQVFSVWREGRPRSAAGISQTNDLAVLARRKRP